MKHLFAFIAFIAATVAFGNSAVLASNADDKLKPVDIIAKHLDSIGKKERREAVKNQILICTVQFNQLGSTSTVVGNAVLASEGEKNITGMNLNSNDYPLERYSFDGEKSNVAFTKPGVYSILGDFIFSNRGLIKEGLFGGAMFSSWALHDIDTRQPRVSLAGTKKIGSIDTYVLDYLPKNALDLDIKMYFDQKTFRHVRTEYSKVIAARQTASINESAGQSPDRIQVVEEFSGFQQMDGLTLPGEYVLTYMYYNNSPKQASRQGNRELTWKFKVSNFSFNQALDANSFDIQTD